MSRGVNEEEKERKGERRRSSKNWRYEYGEHREKMK